MEEVSQSETKSLKEHSLPLRERAKSLELTPTARKGTSIGSFYQDTEGHNFVVRKSGEIVTPWTLDSSCTFQRRREVLSEEEARREYIALKIYKELGINVPEVQLAEVGGKISLIVEDMGWMRSFDFLKMGRESPTEEQIEQLIPFYIASVWLNNPHFILNLTTKSGSDNKDALILTSTIHWGYYSRSEEDKNWHRFHLTAGHWENERKFQKKYGIKINRNDPRVSLVARKIEAISSQRIAEIVLQSGLPTDQIRELIGNLLENKNRILQVYKGVNIEQSLNNTPEWDKLDKILEETESGKIFQEIADKAKVYIISTEAIIENLLFLTNILTTYKDKVKVPSAKKIIIQIEKFRNDRNPDLHKYAEALVKVNTLLNQKGKSVPPFLYKLLGYNKAEEEFRESEKDLKKQVARDISNTLRAFAKKIFDVKEKFNMSGISSADEFWSLTNIPTLTKSQLDTINQLSQNLNSGELEKAGIHISTDDRSDYHLFLVALNGLKRGRLLYKTVCELRSKTFASHLSVSQSIIKTLQSGFLESALYQYKIGKKVHVGSPGGVVRSQSKNFLPQLSFAVNGACLGYGGKTTAEKDPAIPIFISSSGYNSKKEYEHSVGWVNLYPLIVGKNQFAESINTSGEARNELHVFNPNHSDRDPQGIGIPIDNLYLVVPENEKQKWIHSLSEGGKNEEWTQNHLRTYPDWINLDTYLRYFATPQEFGVIPNPGIIVSNFQRKTKVFNFQKEPEALFEWKSL